MGGTARTAKAMAPDASFTEPGTEPAARGQGLLDSRAARAFLIYGLPAVTCLLAGAAIYVSRIRVDQDIHLFAQRQWLAGGSAAVRLVTYDGRGQPTDQVQAELVLIREDGARAIVGDASGVGAPALDFDVSVPDWPPGPCRLEARVQTPVGSEHVAVDVELRHELAEGELVAPPPPPDRTRVGRTSHILGDLTVELLPHGPGLVPELANHLFVRTTDAQGRPRAAELKLALVNGALREPLPETDRTDELGLSVLAVYPQSTEITIEVSRIDAAPEAVDAGPDAGHSETGPDAGPTEAGPDADSPPRSVRIPVPTTPAQMVLRLDEPTPDASVPARVRIQSLHSTRPLYLDAYRKGQWVAARTTRLRDRQAVIEVPGLPPGLALLQAYTSTVQLGYAYSAHHLYMREATRSDGDVLRAIAEELRDRRIDVPYVEALLEQGLLSRPRRYELTAAFLLSRLDQGYRQPTLLVASRRVRSAELEAFQRSFRQRIAVAIGLLGLVVSVLMAYGFSVAALRARQQRRLMELEVGADENDLYVTSMGRPVGLDRFRVIVQIALMVGVVAVGFILIAVLVAVLDWHG